MAAFGRVFLTGGTGYLGGELLNQLLESGYQVRALVRNPSRQESRPGMETVQGDIGDASCLVELAHGCDAVFHCAGLVSAWAPNPTDFYKVNCEGLRNVISACSRTGVGTLIYTSSFFALKSTGMPGAREDSEKPPHGLHLYQHSKMCARDEAMRVRAEGFPIVILYPGVIYGPGKPTEGNLVAQVIKDFVAGRTGGLLGGGNQIWSYAYIKDVACGHIAAFQKCPSGGEFVLGGVNASLREFYEMLAGLTGKKAPRLRIPVSLGAVAGGVAYALARLRGRQPRLTPMAVVSMSYNWACDSTHAREVLGYTHTPLEEGLRTTLRSMGIPPATDRGAAL